MLRADKVSIFMSFDSIAEEME